MWSTVSRGLIQSVHRHRSPVSKEFSPLEERAISIEAGADYRVVNPKGSILRVPWWDSAQPLGGWRQILALPWQLGHGLFTYAMVEGLEGKGARAGRKARDLH
jgi:hypothetical protein